MKTNSSPQIVTLPSGLKVIAAQRPYGKTFAAVLTFRVGSYDDPPGIPGLAHFCEHLAFRGENTEVAEGLAAAGVDINAVTAPEHTQFSAVGHVDYLEQALHCFANVLQKLPLTGNDIEAEREILQHELAGNAEPSYRDAKRDSFWGAILGDPNWRNNWQKQLKAIRHLTKEKVDVFRESYYRPNNACISIVAPFERDVLIHFIERFFRDLISCDSSISEYPRNVVRNRQHAICVDPFAYVWIDVIHIVDQADPVLRITASLIAHLLGGGPHSELFRQLRTQRPLAYDVQAEALPYLNCTAIQCFCSVSTKSVHEVLKSLLDIYSQIADRGITATQLEAEKQRMIRGHEMAMDSPADLAAFLAYEGIRPAADGLIDPDSYLHRLSSISLSEVTQTAARLFAANNRFIFIGGRVGLFSRIRLQRRLKTYSV